MSLKPFQQLDFERLPEKPSRPHKYFDTEAHEQDLQTQSFGKMKVHYRKAGQGPPLLLIHGLMTSSYSWRYLLSPLAQHYTVFIPDLPGAGRSEKVEGYSYGPENLAAWIGEFQSALNIQGCPVIGNSLGGYLAMHLAIRNPKSMSRLINIHSPAFATFKMKLLHFVLRPKIVRELLAKFVRKRSTKWAHRNVHYYDESIKSLEEAKEYGRPLSEGPGVQSFIAYLQQTLAPSSFRRFTQSLEQAKQNQEDFPVPMLLIYARTDPMVPPSIGRRLYELIPSAKLMWLDNSSHFAHIDSTNELMEPIMNFLSEGEPSEPVLKDTL